MVTSSLSNNSLFAFGHGDLLINSNSPRASHISSAIWGVKGIISFDKTFKALILAPEPALDLLIVLVRSYRFAIDLLKEKLSIPLVTSLMD